MSGQKLAALLGHYGYRVTRQTGSHLRLTSALKKRLHFSLTVAFVARICLDDNPGALRARHRPDHENGYPAQHNPFNQEECTWAME